MEMRELKGLEIAARFKVRGEGGVWIIPSQSGNGNYKVALTPHGDTCTCDDFDLTRKPCKHIHAARIVRQRDHGGAVVAIDSEKIPSRPTYKQNWPLYNEAQMTEKRRFQALLFDLCCGITEPPKARTGRKRTPMTDMVFVCAFKVYSGFSSRRFATDLEEAFNKGYLTQMIHSVTTCAFLESDLLTPVLESLIVQSSLPLRMVETTFAPDSTGFSTSKFVRWYDEKYGVEKSGRDWVKVEDGREDERRDRRRHSRARRQRLPTAAGNDQGHCRELHRQGSGSRQGLLQRGEPGGDCGDERLPADPIQEQRHGRQGRAVGADVRLHTYTPHGRL